MFIWTSSFKNQSLVFDIYLTNSKDFWTPIRCQMFALNTFLRVSKSAKLSAKHSPGTGQGWDWLLMEPSCLAESNIITIFAFVFTKPQNCIKPQLYFYFLSATRLKSEKLPRKKCFCKITPHTGLRLITCLWQEEIKYSPHQVFQKHQVMMKEFHVIWFSLIGLTTWILLRKYRVFFDVWF